MTLDFYGLPSESLGGTPGNLGQNIPTISRTFANTYRTTMECMDGHRFHRQRRSKQAA